MKTEYFFRVCLVLVLALTMAAMLAGCDRPAPAEEAPAPTVAAMRLTASRLDLSQELPGRVAALRSAEIRAQVGGIVQRRLFEQGSEVRAGQPLFQIDPAPFRAELETAAATLQRAEAVLARASVQTTRLQPLVDAEAISRQSYDDAVALRDQAAADVAQARAILARRQLDLQHATVAAPIPGRIEQALVTEGALVGSGDSTPMARIAQIDQVYVDVRLPAASLEIMRKVLAPRKATDGGIAVTILRADGEPYDVKGRILFSGFNVDTGSGDVLLRVLVDNPQRLLLPGMFVRARVPLASHADALMLPQQAVVRVAGQPRVWVVDQNNRVQQKPVELGELVDRRYRVNSGVQVGQRVVVEGVERLAEGGAAIVTDWPAEAVPAVANVR
jgi:multidrug efflux system membrane fusion protein